MKTIVYHIGDLNAARLRDKALDTLATQLWMLSEIGQVFLTQRRRADGKLEYRATGLVV